MAWKEQRRAWGNQAREATARPFFGWRVWLLPMFFWPLVLDVPVELIRGNPKQLVGALLGLGLAWYAAALMAQGRRRKGAQLFGVAAGLSAGLAAGITPPDFLQPTRDQSTRRFRCGHRVPQMSPCAGLAPDPAEFHTVS